MDDSLKLDKNVFRALSSDTRIQIIKSLHLRRKTLNELSKELGLSPSTVKEHLQVLLGAGLIILKDDGHKWKYYELSRQGKSLVRPGERNVWMILSVSLAGFLGVLYATFIRRLPSPIVYNRSPSFASGVTSKGVPFDDAAEQAAGQMITNASTAIREHAAPATEGAVEEMITNVTNASTAIGDHAAPAADMIPLLNTALLITFAFLALICVVILLRNRRHATIPLPSERSGSDRHAHLYVSPYRSP